MNYYVYSLLVIHILSIGMYLGEKDDKKLVKSTINICLLLPLYLRILGII